jgi:hypothetical protein
MRALGDNLITQAQEQRRIGNPAARDRRTEPRNERNPSSSTRKSMFSGAKRQYRAPELRRRSNHRHAGRCLDVTADHQRNSTLRPPTSVPALHLEGIQEDGQRVGVIPAKDSLKRPSQGDITPWTCFQGGSEMWYPPARRPYPRAHPDYPATQHLHITNAIKPRQYFIPLKYVSQTKSGANPGLKRWFASPTSGCSRQLTTRPDRFAPVLFRRLC